MKQPTKSTPNKNTQVADVTAIDKFNYVAFAQEYNETLLDIDPSFEKVHPQNNLVIIRCITSPELVPVTLRTNETTNAVIRKLHPEPLMPVGVIVAVGSGCGFNVGQIVQLPFQSVMNPESLNIPNKYHNWFISDPYGYIIVGSHMIQTVIDELPKFEYPTIVVPQDDQD